MPDEQDLMDCTAVQESEETAVQPQQNQNGNKLQKKLLNNFKCFIFSKISRIFKITQNLYIDPEPTLYPCNICEFSTKKMHTLRKHKFTEHPDHVAGRPRNFFLI